jgi:hypothetical protein
MAHIHGRHSKPWLISVKPEFKAAPRPAFIQRVWSRVLTEPLMASAEIHVSKVLPEYKALYLAYT